MVIDSPRPYWPRLAPTLFSTSLLVLASLFASGCALNVVTVGAPAVNCVFDPTCTVPVTDTSAPIPLGTGGTNFLQSRTFDGVSGAPAAGLKGYEYRVDLRNALGTVNIPCVTSMSVNFKGLVSSLDYNGDGTSGDQVYVVTQGGLGTIGLEKATKFGDRITFRFSAPVCAGGSPGSGDSTFFFGLTSTEPPGNVSATVREQGGASHTVPARSAQ